MDPQPDQKECPQKCMEMTKLLFVYETYFRQDIDGLIPNIISIFVSDNDKAMLCIR
jgi:hypothetical protein